MFKFIIVIILIVTFNEKAFPETLDLCDKHPVFCHIVKNNPTIDLDYAMELSNIIAKLAKAYNISPLKLSAILAVESRYELNTVNHKTLDYGVAQINHKTIERYGFDKQKLLTDLEYSVKAGAIVLADLKKMYVSKEKDWYCRYNVGTRSFDKIQDKCANYVKKVKKYL